MEVKHWVFLKPVIPQELLNGASAVQTSGERTKTNSK